MSQAPAALNAVDAYDATAVEEKWRARWERERTFAVDLDRSARPFYNLMMFPYPSAEGLHVGNFYAFSGADIHGRYRRLKGDDVFEPIGFDAFGIHTENYALKIGEHPGTLTPKSVARFTEQLKRLGALFDWEHSVDTTDPRYYRWTQWLFLRLFDAGLAEHREGPVNWCPSCLTVLADEQVIDGHCERCDSRVEKRVLKQWWLKTTRYAQALLDSIEDLDWSEKTRLAQRNWIGRSEGALIRYDLQGCIEPYVNVFTTRPDTLFGATFLVVGADHPRLPDFCGSATPEAVENWLATLPSADAEPDFTLGMDLGSFAVHPITGEKIPVFAAPYVLGSYGTGVIHAVPAHDERDWQFATAHALPIVEVISGGDVTREAWTGGDGVLVNSGEFNGLPWREAIEAVTAKLGESDHGRPSTQFRLRDWLISRQRYWGPPIPIIHCEVDGPVRVPDADLPVLLPEVTEFRPLGTGVSPLAAVEEWVNVPCPVCGRPARRETDVSDTFLDSAWYFIRYPSAERDDVAFDRERTWRWLPVDMYIGGHEHAVLHLLYSRFVMRALFDLGLVPEPEPFRRFRAHGLVIKDGAKMSKSKGNVVNPDEVMARYGVDTLRLYLMSVGPYDQGGEYSDDGIRGITRFLERVWRVTQLAVAPDGDDEQRERRRHRLIRDVDERLAELQYNTAISKLQEFSRHLEREAREGGARRLDADTLLILLASFAPHITEELWERTGHEGSIHNARFPDWDQELSTAETRTIVVQENGTRRGEFVAAAGTDSETLESTARALPRVQEILSAKTLVKVVIVPDRIVNFVVRG